MRLEYLQNKLWDPHVLRTDSLVSRKYGECLCWVLGEGDHYFQDSHFGEGVVIFGT